MDDMELDWLADLFLQHQVEKRHGWTFVQFLKAYERNDHEQLLRDGA